MDYGQYQLDNFLALLATPVGLFGVIAFAALCLLGGRFAPVLWSLVAALMFVPAVTSYASDSISVLISPFKQINDYGRPITTVCMLTVLGLAMLRRFDNRTRLVSPTTLTFFVFEICFDFALYANGAGARASLGLLIHTLTFLTFTFGVGRLLQSERDAKRLLGAIALAGFVIAVGSLAQFVVSPKTAISGYRLAGVTGNPNFAGLIFAAGASAAALLVGLPRQKVIMRSILAVALGVTSFCLFWTASRSAGLVFVVTCAFAFRSNLTRLVIISVIGGAIFLIVSSQFERSQGAGADIFRLDDTRTGVWLSLIGDFLRNPITGMNVEESIAGTENSYLQVAARSGVVGLVPLLATVILATANIVRLWRKRALLQDNILLLNYTCGGLIGLFLAANFEGFLAGVIGIGVSYAYLQFTLLQYLNDLIRQREQQAAGGLATDAEWIPNLA